MARKRGMQFIPYDYEAAYNKAMEDMHEWFIENLFQHRKKVIYALKEITAGDTPCVVEVYAKSTLTNYTITGLGEDIIVESLAAGKTVVIDAKTGLVTIDGANAFDKVDLWEFPVLKAGETALIFSNTKARVTVRYTPMWI